MKQEIINYFENVLGIKSILRSDSVSTNFYKPLIFIENFKSYSPQERELAEKILAAVGLTFDTATIVDVVQSACFIIFKDGPIEANEIFSPRVLLQKPELKKTAWEKLKNLSSL